MPDYAIGDVQGCYDALQRLLHHIRYDDNVDQLWFVGDLVSRGPHSLEVLRFLKNLPKPPKITLGNHDLALLRILFCPDLKESYHESLRQVVEAEDAEELGNWLRHQALLHDDDQLNVVMCHAGIAPIWNLNEAKTFARELESVLTGEFFVEFLLNCFGNQPACWSDSLTGIERLRAITNYLTRMRFCDEKGCLFLEYKGTISTAPKHHIPWYAVPHRKTIDAAIVFGHWASLKGICPTPNIYAIDTGYIWGGELTALRLQDKQRFTVSNELSQIQKDS